MLACRRADEVDVAVVVPEPTEDAVERLVGVAQRDALPILWVVRHERRGAVEQRDEADAARALDAFRQARLLGLAIVAEEHERHALRLVARVVLLVKRRRVEVDAFRRELHELRQLAVHRLSVAVVAALRVLVHAERRVLVHARAEDLSGRIAIPDDLGVDGVVSSGALAIARVGVAERHHAVGLDVDRRPRAELGSPGRDPEESDAARLRRGLAALRHDDRQLAVLVARRQEPPDAAMVDVADVRQVASADLDPLVFRAAAERARVLRLARGRRRRRRSVGRSYGGVPAPPQPAIGDATIRRASIDRRDERRDTYGAPRLSAVDRLVSCRLPCVEQHPEPMDARERPCVRETCRVVVVTLPPSLNENVKAFLPVRANPLTVPSSSSDSVAICGSIDGAMRPTGSGSALPDFHRKRNASPSRTPML